MNQMTTKTPVELYTFELQAKAAHESRNARVAYDWFLKTGQECYRRDAIACQGYSAELSKAITERLGA